MADVLIAYEGGGEEAFHKIQGIDPVIGEQSTPTATLPEPRGPHDSYARYLPTQRRSDDSGGPQDTPTLH